MRRAVAGADSACVAALRGGSAAVEAAAAAAPRLAATCFGSSPFLARTITRWPSATSSPACVVDVHDDAVVVRLHLHRGLVGLDVGQHVSFLDLVPTLTSHWAITPVSMVGLSFGIVTSIGTCLLPGPVREAAPDRGLGIGHAIVSSPQR